MIGAVAAIKDAATKAQWLDAAGDSPCLVVVRRGDDDTFRFLQERTGRRRNIEVVWDRRQRDRRSVRQVMLPERRRAERRRGAPDMWHTLGFIICPRQGASMPTTASAPTRTMAPPAAIQPTPAFPPGERRRAEEQHEPRATAAAAARPPANEPQLAQAVAVVEVDGVLLPSFYDATRRAWPCPRCDRVLVVSTADHPWPQTGDHCLTCHGQVRGVLRRRWQRVNWLGLAALAIGGLVAVRMVGPLIAQLH